MILSLFLSLFRSSFIRSFSFAIWRSPSAQSTSSQQFLEIVERFHHHFSRSPKVDDKHGEGTVDILSFRNWKSKILCVCDLFTCFPWARRLPHPTHSCMNAERWLKKKKERRSAHVELVWQFGRCAGECRTPNAKHIHESLIWRLSSSLCSFTYCLLFVYTAQSTLQSILLPATHTKKKKDLVRSFVRTILPIIAETNSMTSTHTSRRYCVDNNENPSRTVACGKVTGANTHGRGEANTTNRTENKYLYWIFE